MREILVPWDSQPQEAAELHPNLRGVTDVFVGSSFARTLTGTPTVASGVSQSVTQKGYAVGIPAGSGNGLRIAPDQTRILPAGQSATIAVLRRSRDTTGRASTLLGHAGNETGRVLVHAPFSDGNLYWDFGNDVSGSGRVSAPFVKSTEWEALIFIAGPTKGREVWRNRTRIASNPAATGAKTSTAGDFYIGAIGPGGASDEEEVALFVTASAEWTDAEALRWAENPFGATFAPRPEYTPRATGIVIPTLTALPRIDAARRQDRYVWTP